MLIFTKRIHDTGKHALNWQVICAAFPHER